MAKVQSNLIANGLSGGLGRELMFRRLRDGRTILCVKPDFSKRKLSEEQKDHHARFREGAAYARAAAKSEPRYAALAAGTMKTAYNIALADWFHAPVIHAVEVLEGRVRVNTNDDGCVAQVCVSVFDRQGKLLEQGEAVETSGAWWEYAPSALPGNWGKLTIEVRDLAGNVTSTEK